ncbi:MAG: PIN domain-containing protein [Chitinivibrionales bacterium]|nr:PIN domain-containing protein [Chitinivibrionales bacterium]MBD3396189.1 PIN domain-containing protein [Chitinivibrionales bacterium]
MNIVFDTNVVIDALLDQRPFGEDASLLLDSVERSQMNGFLCADSVTTIFYLVEKVRDKAFAREKVGLLLELFEITSVNRAVLGEALALPFGDFEDAVVHQAAVGVNADGIVTCNPRDFQNATVAVYSPRQLISALDLK